MAHSCRHGASPVLLSVLTACLIVALVAGAGAWLRQASAAAVPGLSLTQARVVVGGDNRDNSNGGTKASGDIVRGLSPDAVLNVGDFASSSTDLVKSYEAYWGSFKSITHAVVGNHEANYSSWKTYFSSAQIGTSPNWDSALDLGAGWRFIGLNGNQGPPGVPVSVGSATYNFLKSQLNAHPGPVIVTWHGPRYTWTTVNHTDWLGADAIYRLIKAHGHAIIANGHLHDYQRLQEDGVDGVTEFVVGTGGAPLYPVNPKAPGTRPALRAYDDHEFGALLLTLRPGGYDWAYHAQSGVKDTGTKTF